MVWVEDVVHHAAKRIDETKQRLKQIENPKEKALELMNTAQHIEGALSAALHRGEREHARFLFARLFDIGKDLLEEARDAKTFAAFLQGPLRRSFELLEDYYLFRVPANVRYQAMYIMLDQKENLEKLLEHARNSQVNKEKLAEELKHVGDNWEVLSQSRGYFEDLAKIIRRYESWIRP